MWLQGCHKLYVSTAMFFILQTPPYKQTQTSWRYSCSHYFKTKILHVHNQLKLLHASEVKEQFVQLKWLPQNKCINYVT